MILFWTHIRIISLAPEPDLAARELLVPVFFCSIILWVTVGRAVLAGMLAFL